MPKNKPTAAESVTPTTMAFCPKTRTRGLITQPYTTNRWLLVPKFFQVFQSLFHPGELTRGPRFERHLVLGRFVFAFLNRQVFPQPEAA